MQIREVLNLYQKSLSSIYDDNESRSISELVFMHVFKFSKASLFANDDLEVSDEQKLLLDQNLKRLITAEPVQYVLGETEFYGLRFLVNKNVLIPRSETEELVDWIISEVGSRKSEVGSQESEVTKYKLLDIGTGSGCIPIVIKKNISTLNAYALDISADALSVAKQNAELNNVDVNFIEADILKYSKPNTNDLTYHVIVSNPPYIRKSEMKQMHKNVLNYEPHLALFVEDSDALLFYKSIADFALQHLDTNGKLYFEINEALGNSVTEMINQKGFQNIILKKDMFGKDRMIRCEM